MVFSSRVVVDADRYLSKIWPVCESDRYVSLTGMCVIPKKKLKIFGKIGIGIKKIFL